MTFQYDLEPVLIQRILIGFEALLENLYYLQKIKLTNTGVRLLLTKIDDIRDKVDEVDGEPAHSKYCYHSNQHSKHS